MTAFEALRLRFKERSITMKRTSYSNHMWNSALYGCKFLLRDQLHTDLLVWADTLPNVAAYAAYYPEFSYFEGKKQKKSSYPLAVAARI